MKRRRHWYYIDTWQCVLCGAQRVYRERRYGRRPKRWWNSHRYEEGACDAHFM